jgi:NDP-sugar pyrophosphorylase family protein
LLFPVEHPHLFDAVLADDDGHVKEVRVKEADPGTTWIWGALKLNGRIMQRLSGLWHERDCRDQYMGTLLNAYIESGGVIRAIPAGETYIDVGTVSEYRKALKLSSTRK